jgi:hypothetical protein
VLQLPVHGVPLQHAARASYSRIDMPVSATPAASASLPHHASIPRRDIRPARIPAATSVYVFIFRPFPFGGY